MNLKKNPSGQKLVHGALCHALSSRYLKSGHAEASILACRSVIY
jgi:hypothetical protein